MKKLITLLLFLTLPSCVSVNSASILSAGIIDYEKVSERSVETVSTGKVETIQNIIIVEETDIIPHRKGIRFGIRYIINGSPQGTVVPVTIKAIHPPMLNKSTGEMTEVSEWQSNSKIGVPRHFGHGYEEEGDMPQGKYTFQVYYQGKKMLEKSFIVKDV